MAYGMSFAQTSIKPFNTFTMALGKWIGGFSVSYRVAEKKFQAINEAKERIFKARGMA